MNGGGMVMTEPTVRLVKSQRLLVPGGGRAHEVWVDGVWVGWVYDERSWRRDGAGFGARSWAAAWRQDGDTGVRWRGEGHGTRKAAVEALVAKVADGGAS